MKAAFIFIFAALTLFQCAFCGSVTITTPEENSVGSGTCMTIKWDTSGLKSIQSFNIFFEYENGTEAFNKSTTDNEIYIVFPNELVTYKFYVQAIYGSASKTLDSAKKTVTIADLVCYPDKTTNLIGDPSFENALSTGSSAGKGSWFFTDDIIIDWTISRDERKAHTGKYFILMGARSEATNDVIRQEIQLDSNTKYIGFWTQSIVNGGSSDHYIELLLCDVQIRKWTESNIKEILKSIDESNNNYTFALIEIPAEVHKKYDGKKCNMEIHGYSKGLNDTTNTGIQGMFDDITVGPCTAFSKGDCRVNCTWCASQNMCIDKDAKCTDCDEYNSNDNDNHFGCNWAEGCWYCYAGGGKCIEDGDTSTPGCVKDCSDPKSNKTNNCKECHTLDNQKFFYLDYDKLCPSCNSFSSDGSSVCESKDCQWCAETSSCEDKYIDDDVEQPAKCKTCETLETISECDSKTACSWCYTNNKCQNLETECTNECTDITKSDECSGDCTWCSATEICMTKREFKSNESLCPACAATDCNSTKYPGCTFTETGKCVSINDPMEYCNTSTNATACNAFSGCEWCESSSVCLIKGSSECTKCGSFIVKDKCEAVKIANNSICRWCESEEKCRSSANYTCDTCSGKSKDPCNDMPGCCYVDNNCRERKDGCKDSSKTILIVVVCVCVVVVVVVAIIIIVVVVYVVHNDAKTNEPIEMSTGGNIVVVSDNTMAQPQMADPSMMASMDPSMMNSGMMMNGGGMMMNGGGMMDPSMMNSGMMNSGMMDPSMMNSGMMDPSMMMTGGMMNSGMMDPSMMSMGMTGGMDMNMNSMGMTGGMDMNMNSMGMTGGMVPPPQ